MNNFYIILGLSLILLLVVAILFFIMPSSEIKNGSTYPRLKSKIKIINKTGSTLEDIGTFDASGNLIRLNDSVPDRGSFVLEVYSNKQIELFLNNFFGAILNVNGKVFIENIVLSDEINEQVLFSIYPTSEPLSPYTIYGPGFISSECQGVNQMEQIENTQVINEGSIWPVDPILIRNSTTQPMVIIVLLCNKDNTIIDGNIGELLGYQPGVNNTSSLDISIVPEGGYVFIITNTSEICASAMSIIKYKGKLYYYYFLGQTSNTSSIQILQTNGSSMPISNINIMHLQRGYKPSSTIISKIKGKTFNAKNQR